MPQSRILHKKLTHLQKQWQGCRAWQAAASKTSGACEGKAARWHALNGPALWQVWARFCSIIHMCCAMLLKKSHATHLRGLSRRHCPHQSLILASLALYGRYSW